MKHYTRVLARVNLDAVEYNIEMMKKNIHKNTHQHTRHFLCYYLFSHKFSLLKQALFQTHSSISAYAAETAIPRTKNVYRRHLSRFMPVDIPLPKMAPEKSIITSRNCAPRPGTKS